MEEMRKKVNKKMQILWVHGSERQRRLKEAKDRIVDIQIYASFDYKSWLENFKSHMTKQKMREGDIFRKADIINHTYLAKEDFITQLKNTGFNCKHQEFELVAAKFEETNNQVNVDLFMKSFRPRIENDPRPEKVVINEHVMKEVSKCECEHQFRVDKKETANGLMYQFGDNKSWRLVRILRNSVMVRVGGGWEKLENFLHKQDPCRSNADSKHIHGKINTEIYNFDKKGTGSASMVQISSEYHSRIDSKTKALEDTHKQVSISFHDPAVENTPIKSIAEIAHIKEGSPMPSRKPGSTPVSPSIKKKLDTGASGITPPQPSKIHAPTVRAIQKPVPFGHGDSSKASKSVSRSSSFKDKESRQGSTPTKSGTIKSKAKQDDK
ncbi:Microtubule-actin cross-linking factor [Oopsacas minuta]|uniref:Microtubule-actin cross-linking factor n=1 Tax=Oopsacas minuta TaxID=111878 RepID=A0AAV7KD30_9METZ|nr:Microtubule-actin cross-linking factor [Oopsacas minuta]